MPWECRIGGKSGTEPSIPLESVLRAVVPQITHDILKIQKVYEVKGKEANYEQIIGEHNYEMVAYLESRFGNMEMLISKCVTCNFYPFSLLLDQGGRLEFVASNISTLNQVVSALTLLIKKRKYIAKFKGKIETMNIA